MIKDNTKDKVISKLNAEFGNDIKNLSKCKDLVKKFADEKQNIEKEILKKSKNVSSPETTSDINSISHSIEEVTKEFSKVCEIAKEKGNDHYEIINDLESRILKIQQLEQGLCYLRCVQSIQELSANIQTHLASRSDAEAVTEFTMLCNMCGRLQYSKCAHLKTFLSDTLHHWHNVLKDMFSIQLDEVLRLCGWPRVSTNILVTPPAEALARFQLTVEHLLSIQLLQELSPLPAVTSSLLANFPPISLPVTLLLKPLRKRFIFHFCGSKQTNRPDKPEWFMTQVLSWIRHHEHFLTQWVQPVFNKVQQSHISAQMEFTQGLVQLVVDKLHSDLPTLMYDDTLFSHTVDETLGFDRELRECSGYPESLPSAVTVLTQAHVFVKWIHMERKYARDKMDVMLSSETAWAEVGGSEDLKITETAESFLTLLSMMTERYNVLPQPGHRLQFVDLQSELVDELRVRFLQLLHSERHDPLDSRLPAILNTAAHISRVLTEWGTSPHFLLLQHYRSQLEMAGTEVSSMNAATLQQATVFDQALSLLDLLIRQLVDVLCEAVMMEVKARSRPYRKDKWFAMVYEPCLTPSACPMFQVLTSKLHSLQSVMALPLFTTAWQSVAEQLCAFLLEELVLQNRFNEGGAKQFEQDLNRSLIPLFYQYTQRPEAYFMPLKEACALLNIRPLPAEWNKGKYNQLPIEIHHLSPEMVHNIIQKRADVIPDII